MRSTSEIFLVLDMNAWASRTVHQAATLCKAYSLNLCIIVIDRSEEMLPPMQWPWDYYDPSPHRAGARMINPYERRHIRNTKEYALHKIKTFSQEWCDDIAVRHEMVPISDIKTIVQLANADSCAFVLLGGFDCKSRVSPLGETLAEMLRCSSHASVVILHPEISQPIQGFDKGSFLIFDDLGEEGLVNISAASRLLNHVKGTRVLLAHIQAPQGVREFFSTRDKLSRCNTPWSAGLRSAIRQMAQRSSSLAAHLGHHGGQLDMEIRTGNVAPQMRRLKHSFEPTITFYSGSGSRAFATRRASWVEMYQQLGNIGF